MGECGRRIAEGGTAGDRNMPGIVRRREVLAQKNGLGRDGGGQAYSMRLSGRSVIGVEEEWVKPANCARTLTGLALRLADNLCPAPAGPHTASKTFPPTFQRTARRETARPAS